MQDPWKRSSGRLPDGRFEPVIGQDYFSLVETASQRSILHAMCNFLQSLKAGILSVRDEKNRFLLSQAFEGCLMSFQFSAFDRTLLKTEPLSERKNNLTLSDISEIKKVLLSGCSL
jgi:hypothetical protein